MTELTNKEEAMERGRYVFFDTETTGLKPAEGHRIIEVGAVEVIDRQITGQTFYCLVNPERDSDERAIEVHGHSNESLKDKPLFGQEYEKMAQFFDGAVLVAHNAAFDIGFLDAEMARLRKKQRAADRWTFVDSLAVAKRIHPGQQNSLDALCRRYQVDLSGREKHGALIDSELLANVYIAMTSVQMSVLGGIDDADTKGVGGKGAVDGNDQSFLPIPTGTRTIKITEAELQAHQDFLEDKIEKKIEGESPFGKW